MAVIFVQPAVPFSFFILEFSLGIPFDYMKMGRTIEFSTAFVAKNTEIFTLQMMPDDIIRPWEINRRISLI